MKATYKGFSTINRLFTNNFGTRDANCVKIDLINAFKIKRGELCLRVNDGTLIWNYLMEQETTARPKIKAEVERIIASEPRVKEISNTISFLEHGVTIQLVLQYVELDQVETMFLNFQNSGSLLYGFDLNS